MITAIGYWGGFPQPPYIIKLIFQYQPVQYLMVMFLVWQGKGGASNNDVRDILVSVAITALFFIITRFLNTVYTKEDLDKALAGIKEGADDDRFSRSNTPLIAA